MTGPRQTLRALTDGRTIAALTPRKVGKDLIADFLLTLAASSGAVVLMGFFVHIVGQEAFVLGTSVVGAFARTAYRAALRWALAP